MHRIKVEGPEDQRESNEEIGQEAQNLKNCERESKLYKNLRIYR